MPSLPQGLTFDDVLLIPQESDLRPSDTVVKTNLTKRLLLEIPIISAAMDTVTDAGMAIAMAKEGGLGVLHRNCTIAQQVEMVKEVKRAGIQSIGAAIGPHDQERAVALSKAGVTILFVDCAHAHKPSIVESARSIKKAVKAELVIGNIATAQAARALVSVASALKVGVGPGSICTTRVVAGVGVPQLTAIQDVVGVAKKFKVPVIGDGGIRYSGDIVKALAAGASCVMLGSLLAATKESAGTIVTIDGKEYKQYRGMGSLGAMNAGNSSDRYGQKGAKKYVPEGVEALTPLQGTLHEVLFQLLGGLKAGMGYCGARTIAELQRNGKFIRITEAGRVESHPHSIRIEKKAPNYS